MTKIVSYAPDWRCKECGSANTHRRAMGYCRQCYTNHNVRKHRFGLTETQYYELIARQKGRCAICGSNHAKNKVQTNLHVDHCHTTKRVRGLLCMNCNAGLGQFKDDKELVKRALSYLEAA